LAIFTLTPDADTFACGPGDNTVYRTAATLTAGHSQTSGSGDQCFWGSISTTRTDFHSINWTTRVFE
jgi:hypothetical protein